MSRPEVIGHRGAAALAPENTLASLRASIQAGVRVIEFDVRVTADGRAAVVHDRTLDRTTDGRGAIRARTWAQIRALDAGTWFDRRFAGERVPSLEDALCTLRGHAAAIVELKADDRDEARAVVEAVARALAALARGARRELTVSSGTWRLPGAVRLRVPDVRTALVVGRTAIGDEIARARRERCAALHVALSRATAARVSRAAKVGIEVAAWTVRDPSVVPRLVRNGVTAVFADDPPSVRATIAACTE